MHVIACGDLGSKKCRFKIASLESSDDAIDHLFEHVQEEHTAIMAALKATMSDEEIRGVIELSVVER